MKMLSSEYENSDMKILENIKNKG